VKAKVEKPKEKAVAVQPEVDNLGAKVSKATWIGPSLQEGRSSYTYLDSSSTTPL